MSALTQPLQVLEAQALHHLQSVDLATPMAQLHAVFEALIDVPTRERRADTAFTRQASAALDGLLEHTQKLSALVCMLTEHLGSTMTPATIGASCLSNAGH
jgi:hypothetical protein